MTNKILFEKAKKDAKRFCRRNSIYNTYDESVAKMVEKLYVTTYLRAFHQLSTEVKENATKWHKVADGDLPKENRTVLDEAGDRFYYSRGHFYYEGDSRFDCQPIAWCEIPKYMEE